MNTKSIIVGAVLVIVGVIGGLLISRDSAPQLGAAGNQLIEQYDSYVRYNGGIRTALPIEADGGISVDGTITVDTSNTATSTLSVGCVQTTATSTASPIILVFGTSFTGTTTLPSGIAGSGGLVAWKFGTCPNL